MLALDVQNMTKQYKNGVRALNGLAFQVREGEVFSLLGPNGAGKSTLIHILTTFYRPTAGQVQVFGRDLCQNPAWVRSQVACVAQQISVDDHLTMEENMLFQSRMYHVPPKTAKDRMEKLIQGFDLEEYRKRPTASYSGGVKRRLDIAMNLISQPKILYLDEPTVGMDIQSRLALWEMLGRIRKEFNTTIFLTTHYLEEADAWSDSVCIMKKGRALAQGSPRQLRSYTRQNLLRVLFPTSSLCKTHAKSLEQLEFVTAVHRREESLLLTVKDSQAAFAPTNRFLLDQALPFIGVEIVQPSLEDVFLSLTAKEETLA